MVSVVFVVSSVKNSAVHFFWKGVLPKCFGWWCLKWHHASWLHAYCKVSCWPNPKYRSALSERSRTILTRYVRGVCVRMSGGCVCGLLRASGRTCAVRVFAKNVSAHFSEFPRNFREISATFTGAVETIFGKFSAKKHPHKKHLQNFRNFAKCSCSTWGGHCVKLCEADCSVAACRSNPYIAFLLEARGSHSGTAQTQQFSKKKLHLMPHQNGV